MEYFESNFDFMSKSLCRNLPKHRSSTRSGDHLWIPYRLYAFDNIWTALCARFLMTPAFFELLHRIVYTVSWLFNFFVQVVHKVS